MKKKIILIPLLLIASVFTVKAQITEKSEFGRFAITGATIHTVTNGTIENGVILIENDKITFVGKNAKINPDFTRVDASGKHVYPGFIDASTQLGLVEINAVAVTVDSRELGPFNAHIRAFTAINPGSASIPVTRVSGVTNVVAAPLGSRISGKSTLIDLWGYSPDSMAVLGNSALHMSLPSNRKAGWWDSRSDKEIKEQYERQIKQLNDYWQEAMFYNKMMSAFEDDPQGKTKPDKDRGLDAMREVVSGEVPVVISVNNEKDILNVLEWIKDHPDVKFILSGVREGFRVADKIAEAGVPVIVSTLYTPTRQYDNYQRPYQNPGMLHEAGVKVMLSSFETENVRNLNYNAGYAATYGLGTEEALKAVTINTAEAFGVADKLGSLEVGKQANLFISDGDPFEPLTNIEHVFIAGHKIPMVSRHTQLFEEFLDRDKVNE